MPCFYYDFVFWKADGKLFCDRRKRRTWPCVSGTFASEHCLRLRERLFSVSLGDPESSEEVKPVLRTSLRAVQAHDEYPTARVTRTGTLLDPIDAVSEKGECARAGVQDAPYHPPRLEQRARNADT